MKINKNHVCLFVILLLSIKILCSINNKKEEIKTISGKINNEKNCKKEIDLVYILDDLYTLPTAVSMTSALKNKNFETFIRFNIMIPEEFKEENSQKLLKIQNLSKDCSIEFHKILKEVDYGKCSSSSYWSKVVFYKLFIENYVKSDKCIYVDGDTAILKDLKELYDIDISDYFLAGVHDIQFADSKKKTYINSGVMLLNLKKCRQENLSKKYKEFLEKAMVKKETYCFADQFVINELISDKILDLPLKFNTQNYFELDKDYEELDEKTKKCFTKEVYNEVALKKETVIVHYVSCTRPWAKQEGAICFFYEDWWKNAEKSEVYEEIKKTFEDAYKRAKLVLDLDETTL